MVQRQGQASDPPAKGEAAKRQKGLLATMALTGPDIYIHFDMPKKYIYMNIRMYRIVYACIQTIDVCTSLQPNGC